MWGSGATEGLFCLICVTSGSIPQLTSIFGFVSMQLVSPGDDGIPSQTQFYAEDSVPSLSNPPIQNLKNRTPDLVDADADSSLENNKIKSKKDFSKQMHFVND